MRRGSRRIPRTGEERIPLGRDDLRTKKADAEVMEFIRFEIIGLLTSPAVLLSTVGVALVFLSGLAAEALLFFENLRCRWSARTRNPCPASTRYRTHVAVEIDIVR
jgi:hypothetical protein